MILSIIVTGIFSGKSDINLVMKAFKKSYDKRNYPTSFLFHSNQGFQNIHPSLYSTFSI